MANLLSSFKQMPRRGKVVSLLVFLFLLLAIVLTAYEVRQQQSYRSNAQVPLLSCSGPTVRKDGPNGPVVSSVSVGDRVIFEFVGNPQDDVDCESSTLVISGSDCTGTAPKYSGTMATEGGSERCINQGTGGFNTFEITSDYAGCTGISVVGTLKYKQARTTATCNGSIPVGTSSLGTGLCLSGVQAYTSGGGSALSIPELNQTAPGVTVRYAVEVADNVGKVLFNGSKLGINWNMGGGKRAYYVELPVKDGINTVTAAAQIGAGAPPPNPPGLVPCDPPLTFNNTPARLNLTVTCGVRMFDKNWNELCVNWVAPNQVPCPADYAHSAYAGEEVYIAAEGFTRYCGMYCGGAAPLPSCQQHPDTQCPVQDCEGWTCIGGNTYCRNPLCPDVTSCECPGQISVDQHFSKATFTVSQGSKVISTVVGTEGHTGVPIYPGGYWLYGKYTLPGNSSSTNQLTITAKMDPKSFGRDDPFVITNAPSCNLGGDPLYGFYVNPNPPSGGTPTPPPFFTCSGPTVRRLLPGGWEIVDLSDLKKGDRAVFDFVSGGDYQDLVDCEKSTIVFRKKTAGNPSDPMSMYTESVSGRDVCVGPDSIGFKYYPVSIDGEVTSVTASLFYKNGIGLVDCGAAPGGSATPTPTPTPTMNPKADINGDGCVNSIDLGILIDNYNPVAPGCTGK
jgi:hypothetical protein